MLLLIYPHYLQATTLRRTVFGAPCTSFLSFFRLHFFRARQHYTTKHGKFQQQKEKRLAIKRGVVLSIVFYTYLYGSAPNG